MIDKKHILAKFYPAVYHLCLPSHKMSSGSLTPAPSSSQFSTFAQDKASIDVKLDGYQAQDAKDDTAKFLKIFFKYLPQDGQNHLAEDICSCSNDATLRQLAESLDTGLLRPMKSKGGKTPAITRSSRLGIEDSIENLYSLDLESATRKDQQKLRAHCLKRDGNQCIISKTWDKNSPYPAGAIFAPLDATHIIPFALGAFKTDDERRQISEVWVNILRYFPSLRSRLNMSPADVNKEDNIMMMLSSLHVEFGNFEVIFEATETPNRYRLKTFPTFSSYFLSSLPSDKVVTLTCCDNRYPLPNPIYLAVHAAIGNILHASGRAEVIDKLVRDLGDAGGLGLAKDGSTNIGDLLSVSQLSILSSGWNRLQPSTNDEAKPTLAASSLSGTENRKPRSQNT
jgi:hypothetical protein